MIASDCEHIRFSSQENRQRSIQFCNRIAFRCKVSVLTLHIGILEMDEEEIVIMILRMIPLELLRDSLRPFELGHAYQLSKSFVHRIDRQACCAQFVTLGKSRNLRLMSNAAQ